MKYLQKHKRNADFTTFVQMLVFFLSSGIIGVNLCEICDAYLPGAFEISAVFGQVQ